MTMTSTYFSLQEVNAMNNLFRATGAGRVGSKMSSVRDGAAVERAVAEVDDRAEGSDGEHAWVWRLAPAALATIL